MFITMRRHHDHPKTVTNANLANGLLVSLIAAILLLAGVSGTTVLSSTNQDQDRSEFPAPLGADSRVPLNSTAPTQASFSTNANETPRWPSDIMDSYESVPSLAALAKQGNSHDRLALDVSERQAVLPLGISR